MGDHVGEKAKVLPTQPIDQLQPLLDRQGFKTLRVASLGQIAQCLQKVSHLLMDAEPALVGLEVDRRPTWRPQRRVAWQEGVEQLIQHAHAPCA